jgi:hypothetical protein
MSGEGNPAGSRRPGGPPAERLREQLQREFGETPPESPSEREVKDESEADAPEEDRERTEHLDEEP